MQVLIDYLTLTTKYYSVQQFIDELGLSDCTFLTMGGRYGWRHRMYYAGCSFFYGGDRDDICIELSGTGCRVIEEVNDGFDWFSFLTQFVYEDEETKVLSIPDVSIARLDIAGDDRDGILEHRKMVHHCLKRKYICKARYRIWIDGDEQQIYFGSPASDRRLRIYNKALEQGLEESWTRCEMQFRNKNADSFLLNWYGKKSIGQTYSEVLLDFLRFTDQVPDGVHYDRLDVSRWWVKFIGGLDKCHQLYCPKAEYTLSRVRKFFEKNAASSLKTILLANNGDWQDIIDIVNNTKLNSRQTHLLDKIKESGLLST